MSEIKKVAVLDLYEGTPNEGMRCITEILKDFQRENDVKFQIDYFEVRQRVEIPDLSYDIYISSGGPGSPLDSENSLWDNSYMDWLESLWEYNEANYNEPKYAFFICHSFQLLCRYFQIGTVCLRARSSFGVYPITHLEGAEDDPIMQNLPNPFYVCDFRKFQVIQPDQNRIESIGCKLLAIEKERPHIPLERAIMALRLGSGIFATQFHPEADPVGMKAWLQNDEKRKEIIENHGYARWQLMMDGLNDPDKIMLTQKMFLPVFLGQSIGHFQEI